ncbi:putative late blight resistance protein homolog R1A-10 [Salvia miltiorrhiza]|uniref:putative late blight resistance protein homolog R1A-10 n=1 Tax=Salvia miltiorrhiza TaxID=226208 RepID=UPI0025AC6D40|nr:putative late blight resistance protein homolog R1A-10 [Salvia miltiorrhiza]
MAFTAVISLKNTICRLLNSPRISVASPTRETLEFAYERVDSLQESLRRYDDVRNSSKGVMALDARIREEARKLEDVIESEASAQFLLQSEIHGTLSLNLHHSISNINRFAETATRMEQEYIMELNKPSAEEEENAAAAVVPFVTNSVGNEFEMVGLCDQFLEIRELLIEGVDHHKFYSTIAIHGMAGIGKTKLAQKLFRDSLVKASFDCRAFVTLASRAFVTLGSERDLEEILLAIIAQVNHDNAEMIRDEDEDLANYLQTSLSGRKFLIVLDDVLDSDLFYRVLAVLPLEHNDGRILITTRAPTNFSSVYIYKIRFMDDEESWDFLRKKVFDEQEELPHPLVKAGKKIAKNCEGLPLLIHTVAGLLSEAPKNPEHWNQVAEKRNSVFEDALDQLNEVLLPTYQRIPQYAKMNFLYMGAFPPDYIITNSRLGNLWWAEGFHDLASFDAPHILGSCNLVVVRETSTITGRTKACSLHCAYRHMAKREAESNKLFHVLNSYADCSIECVQRHRCLAIHQNVLFAIKDVHDTMASVAAVRSVLCMGPYHQYQVPICSGWELLRVLDALTIRFYEFPPNLVNLILLRYLALTCNASLPRSLSNLWNLQYLIIHEHLRIKCMAADNSCLPMEIWDLKELMHLRIMGRNLPTPPPGTVLPKLAELLDVGVQTCSTKVLKSLPNLEKLRVQIESAENLSCFDRISCLNHLRSLQGVVMYPNILPEPIIPPTPPLSISTSSLQKLSLEGFGLSWMEMSKIAELPNLEKLILQCYAFQGEKWDASGIVFSRLWYICIEDTDLVQWRAGEGTFPRLRRLTMKNCYNIEEIPAFVSNVEVEEPSDIVIELVDCNPLAETCAKQWCPSILAHYSWK